MAFSAPDTISPTKLSMVLGGTWNPVYWVRVGAAYTATMLAPDIFASMVAYSATCLLCSERSRAHTIFCSFAMSFLLRLARETPRTDVCRREAGDNPRQSCPTFR